MDKSKLEVIFNALSSLFSYIYSQLKKLLNSAYEAFNKQQQELQKSGDAPKILGDLWALSHWGF
jgi:hypothetical protein